MATTETMNTAVDTTVRALMSEGQSAPPILTMVFETLAKYHHGGGTVLDIGCGQGELSSALGRLFERYIGADVVRYDHFPHDAEFHSVDLDTGRVDLPDGSADVVVSVETIEHLENPRTLFREAVRLTKPGGLTVITTPNQLSFLSKGTLLFKNNFTAFGKRSYPAHLTALLEIDLRRMAGECGLLDVAIVYGYPGRIPLTPRRYPGWVARCLPRSLCDTVLVIGRKPGETESPLSPLNSGHYTRNEP
jgi:SAM-dependent methyltransferase